MHDELTQVDIDKMKEELARREAMMPALRAEVKRTRELGDLSENDEYRTAKREINENRRRMRYLEGMIKTAKIITTDSAIDEVGLFDEVEVYIPKKDETKKVRIVTTLRNDVFTNNISKESPFGKALLGAKAGETVTEQLRGKSAVDQKRRGRRLAIYRKFLNTAKGQQNYELRIQN